MDLIQFIKETFSGRSIYRSLFHIEVKKSEILITGRVLDIGAGARPSYKTLLPKNIEYIKTDYREGEGVLKLDFNAVFPYGNSEFDTVLLFNNLYIAENQASTLKEIVRVLKPGGYLLVASPFVSNEMPEPHDYNRLTKEGLDRLFESVDISTVSCRRLGDRFSVAAYALHPVFLISPIRLVGNLLALFLDSILPRNAKTKHPFPLGYYYVLRK